MVPVPDCMAWNMAEASLPRTSPTMTLVNAWRRLGGISWAISIAPCWVPVAGSTSPLPSRANSTSVSCRPGIR